MSTPPPAPEKCGNCKHRKHAPVICGILVVTNDMGESYQWNCDCEDPFDIEADLKVSATRTGREFDKRPPAPIPAEQEKREVWSRQCGHFEAYACGCCPECRVRCVPHSPDPAVQHRDLIEAVRALYYAAVWTPDRDIDAARLWSDVRDAAGFEHGNSPSPAPTVQRENSVGGTISVPCVFPASGIVVATEDNSKTVSSSSQESIPALPGAVGASVAPAPQRCDEQRPQRGTEEMRQFSLNRIEDETGISGIGVVAQGVIFADGRVAMRWLTAHTSFCFYDSIDEVEAIHGHNGRTRIEYLAENERLKDENIHHEFEIENLTARLRASQEVRERLCEKLATATSRLRQCEEANHRAFKLMERGTPFFVVKASEPYARQVVNLIKEHEGWKWTDEDELWALRALAAPAPDVLDKKGEK